jgi:hypothetical protein
MQRLTRRNDTTDPAIKMAATPFQKEAWAEYGVGIIILFLRIITRCRLVGSKWEGDDYFAVLAIAFWTVWKENLCW